MLSVFRGLIAVLVIVAFAGTGAAPTDRVEVRLDLAQEFYYAGDALTVRVSIRNAGAERLANPIKAPILESFVVKTAGKTLKVTGKPVAEEPTRPEQLSPESFYGGLVNLVDLYPELGEVGRYEIYWSGNRIISNMLVVTIIPRYDPTKNYIGRIETNRGSIEVEFYAQESPIAVKSFVDMANAGYYDGLLIHEVQGDTYVMGGDGRYVSPPRPSIRFPAEQSSLPLVAGTMVLRPSGPAPPANGSSFVILLRPQPKWIGQVTVLGQVIRGLDIVREISNVPSTMRSSTLQFKPLRDVVIRAVTIREKPARNGT